MDGHPILSKSDEVRPVDRRALIQASAVPTARSRREWISGAISGHDVYRLRFASGIVSSRTRSMKSRATGLIVRFLRVIIPIGNNGMGSCTGKILSGGRFEPKCNRELGKIPRKGPLAMSAQTR